VTRGRCRIRVMSTDPVLDALDNAPIDLEPETRAEREAIAAAKDGQKKPHAEVERAIQAPAAE
jgi:hypothetical protein